MLPRQRHVKVVRKRLAGGETRLYRYHRPTMARLYEEPGTPKATRELEIIAGTAGVPIRSERDVYFIRAATTGLIKIGVATNTAARLSALRGGSPDCLELLGVIVCKERGALEKRLHARFALHRVHGEWFRPDPELLAFIAENVPALAVPCATV